MSNEEQTAGQHLRALANNASAKRIEKIEAYLSKHLLAACEPFAEVGRMSATVRFSKDNFGVTDPRANEVMSALEDLTETTCVGINVKGVKSELRFISVDLSWN